MPPYSLLVLHYLTVLNDKKPKKIHCLYKKTTDRGQTPVEDAKNIVPSFLPSTCNIGCRHCGVALILD